MLPLSQHSKELARRRWIEGATKEQALAAFQEACSTFPAKKKAMQGQWTVAMSRCVRTKGYCFGFARGKHNVVMDRAGGATWHVHIMEANGQIYGHVGEYIRGDFRSIKDQDVLELFWMHLERTLEKQVPGATLVVKD